MAQASITIQAAINAASAGDTILVQWTYTRILTTGERILLFHKIDRVNLTIKPSNSSQPIVYFNNSETDDAVLDGLL